MELRLVCLLVVCNAFECLQLLVERVSLQLELRLRTLGVFELPSDMVNVPLERQNLLHVILFLLLMLGEGEGSTPDLFLGRLNLAKKLLIFPAKRLYSILQPFHLNCGVTIVRKNVLFLNLQSPRRLLSSSLFVH